MRKLLLLTAVLGLLPAAGEAKTIHILMESVPDTRYVQEMLPAFKERTGIDVDIEVVNYAEMHTKLVPQLLARRAPTTRSWSTSTGWASSPRQAGCSRWTSGSRPAGSTPRSTCRR